jgi:hypothetical protein
LCFGETVCAALVAGAGIFPTPGTEYAALIWNNPTTGQLGMANFTPSRQNSQKRSNIVDRSR